GERASLRLADQGSSRHHAEVFRMGSLHFVRDLESRNGTFVNDRRTVESILREGDEIRIGETVLVFLETEAAAQARVVRLRDEPTIMPGVEVWHGAASGKGTGSGSGAGGGSGSGSGSGSAPAVPPASDRSARRPGPREGLASRLAAAIAKETDLKSLL